ncbi:MAG: hypothetical protein ACWA45_06445 [Flavobacteriales bacterium]
MNYFKTFILVGACALISSVGYSQKSSSAASTPTNTTKTKKTVTTTEKSEKEEIRNNGNTVRTNTGTSTPGAKTQKKTVNTNQVSTKNTLSTTSVDIDEAKKRIKSAKMKIEKQKADGVLTEEQYLKKLEKIKQAEIYINELQTQMNDNKQGK